jgi:hypothetical protein
MHRVQTQVSDWGSVLKRARWNFCSKIDTLWHNSSGMCVCESACVWTNRKWKSYFWPGDWNACSSLRAPPPPPEEHCRRVCDRAGVLLPTVPTAVLHNWLSTTCSVIAALQQLALATAFLLLKSCQVERMWCTASLTPPASVKNSLLRRYYFALSVRKLQFSLPVNNVNMFSF